MCVAESFFTFTWYRVIETLIHIDAHNAHKFYSYITYVMMYTIKLTSVSIYNL